MRIESERQALAYATINREPAKGIPTAQMNIMEHSVIDRLAGMPIGSYVKNPDEVYLKMQREIGVGLYGQHLTTNPLSMDTTGFLGHIGNTTGAQKIYAGTMLIESPEDAAEHMEKHVIPGYVSAIEHFQEDAIVTQTANNEINLQKILGPDILKTGHGVFSFPTFAYGTYGYEYYFGAYALFPEVFDRVFTLMGDYAYLYNKAVVKGFIQAERPLFSLLDHDMADGRGVLVNPKTLERAWVPAFIKSMQPAVEAGFTLVWHCDGDLNGLIPYLLEGGVSGFQGFQYEFGMDYPKICNLKAKDGKSMFIWAGVSVTRELPMGTPDDVKRQVKELVEYGPKTGLFLGMSSSCVPGTPYENIKTALEGMKYYREHGRD